MKMNGAQALVRSLVDQGVEVIFGIPGGVAIPIYDALYDAKGLRNMLMRHEQGAAHAADGYSRATGKVGVCLATSGPGATNLVTGIATAYMDSIPMLAITGQVRTTALGKDSFQEADITGITLPITKHNYLVKNANDLPRVIAEAMYIARTGRPGPVLVDIPMDVSLSSIDYSPSGKSTFAAIRPVCGQDVSEETIESAAENDSRGREAGVLRRRRRDHVGRDRRNCLRYLKRPIFWWRARCLARERSPRPIRIRSGCWACTARLTRTTLSISATC